MGFEQIKSGRLFLGTNLVFEGWPANSEVRTFAANAAITDSAAAGTAMATGHKADNGVVSVALPGDGGDYETVLEFFKRHGRRTGLVTTSAITDATPAVFGAHVNNRGDGDGVALDYLTFSRPNVLFGAGGLGISPAKAEAAGYTVITSRAGLLAIDTATETLVSGQFGFQYMPYEYDGLNELPHLSEMTETALQILSHATNGFFLMVEGGRIDHASHANDLARCVREVAEFDRAARVVMAWASNRTDTLVLVTADHETGGLKVLADNGPGLEPGASWSTTGHTATNIGLFAWGLGSGAVTGVVDNTDVYRTIMRAQSVTPVGRGIQTTPEGSFETVWDAPIDATCTLESVDTLTETNWIAVASTTASTHVVNMVDINPPSGARFYRLQSSP